MNQQRMGLLQRLESRSSLAVSVHFDGWLSSRILGYVHIGEAGSYRSTAALVECSIALVNTSVSTCFASTSGDGYVFAATFVCVQDPIQSVWILGMVKFIATLWLRSWFVYDMHK